ncbi:MAG TPA: 30S ribosome-binding factor RbfA [Tenericutes bacterium]|jgi:ribosome-binding factor A|nr:30S ribosome-binding factor RbfA [Mycoplasmatota bacterium]
MSFKYEKYGSQIQREIATILLNEVKAEDLKFVSIIKVEVTNDLGYATIYYRVLNDDKKEKIAKSLEEIKGFLRSQIAKRVQMRKMPQLIFKYDDSLDKFNEFNELIKRVKEKEGK